MAAPDFIARDADAIVQEMVASLEAEQGKTLYPAQPERLLINWMAYRATLHRAAVQDAAALNLVRYSRGAVLEELAADRGTARLPAFSAGCLLQFSLPAARQTDLVIPAGTVVSTSDGALMVATNESATIVAGSLSVTVAATSTEAGTAGNGYVAGQVRQLVSIIPGAPASLTVSNVSTTNGGAEAETDPRLQQRLLLTFDSYSVAGPAPAYRYIAMAAHPSVIDVAVVSHTPGEVTLYPLLDTGLPGPTVIDAVQAAASSDDKRVLCDTVVTAACVERPYTISGTVWLKVGTKAEDILSAAEAALLAEAESMEMVLGGDIVPSRFSAVLQSLVHRVELAAPAFAACEKWEWRRCTSIDLAVGA